ncbi:transposase [Streptomyces laculatispora]|uniref:Transposase n=1 Tax=Streptomyces laculatispora TaxID=887464 RepID=A0ABY9I5W1_9ACTN|nr:transposase [Streptomyces laculatispora]WLQ42190.1 transposase [Streptomyces laculatispora]
MKHYPPDFKASAVALYRSRPGATIKLVAGNLGVNTETLRNWIRAADGRRSASHTTSLAAGPAESTPLEAENAMLRKQNAELRQERDILPQGREVFRGLGSPCPHPHEQASNNAADFA